MLATLRTVDAVKTIERIVDVFPADQQPQARLQLRDHPARHRRAAARARRSTAAWRWRSRCCCRTPEVIKCIRTGDSANLAKAILGGVSSGMGTMDQSLAELVQEGLVDVEVAAERAVDPAELRYLTSGPT